MIDDRSGLNNFIVRLEYLDADFDCLDLIKPVLAKALLEIIALPSIKNKFLILSIFKSCILSTNEFEDSIETVEREAILEYLYDLGEFLGISRDTHYLESWRGDW